MTWSGCPRKKIDLNVVCSGGVCTGQTSKRFLCQFLIDFVLESDSRFYEQPCQVDEALVIQMHYTLSGKLPRC